MTGTDRPSTSPAHDPQRGPIHRLGRDHEAVVRGRGALRVVELRHRPAAGDSALWPRICFDTVELDLLRRAEVHRQRHRPDWWTELPPDFGTVLSHGAGLQPPRSHGSRGPEPGRWSLQQRRRVRGGVLPPAEDLAPHNPERFERHLELTGKPIRPDHRRPDEDLLIGEVLVSTSGLTLELASDGCVAVKEAVWIPLTAVLPRLLALGLGEGGR